MQKNVHFFIIALLFISLQVSLKAQYQDTLYILGNGYDFTSMEAIKKIIKQQEEKMKQDKTDNFIVKFEVFNEKMLGDTLIQHGTISFKSLGLASEDEKAESRLNKPIPDFELSTLYHKNINPKDLKGKVTLINFWFTRCAPCIAEMPYLNKIKKEYENKEVVFLSMTPEKEEKIKEFLQKYPFHFTHIPDADNFLKQFGVGFPKNILIDKKGIIRYIGMGLIGENKIEDSEKAYAKNRASIDMLKNKIDELLVQK